MGVATGTFQLPNGSPVANGTWQWSLSADAIELSVAAICPRVIRGQLDSNGNMTATFLFNDIITTAQGTNTFYQLTIKEQTGGQVWNQNYYLTGAAANVNLVAPGSIYGGPFFYPVIAGNAADSVQTFNSNGLAGFAGAPNTFIEAFGGSGGITISVTSAVGVTGQRMRIMKMDTAAGGVVIISEAGNTFNGQSSFTLTNQYQCQTIESDNTNWFVVASAG